MTPWKLKCEGTRVTLRFGLQGLNYICNNVIWQVHISHVMCDVCPCALSLFFSFFSFFSLFFKNKQENKCRVAEYLRKYISDRDIIHQGIAENPTNRCLQFLVSFSYIRLLLLNQLQEKTGKQTKHRIVYTFAII